MAGDDHDDHDDDEDDDDDDDGDDGDDIDDVDDADGDDGVGGGDESSHCQTPCILWNSIFWTAVQAVEIRGGLAPGEHALEVQELDELGWTQELWPRQSSRA